MHNSKNLLLAERFKLENRANIYRERAKYYLGVLNYLNEIKRSDDITLDDTITVKVLHFGTEQSSDQFFIDADLLSDLLKIQANRFWNRHDRCMTAVMKINKALEHE